MPAVALTSLMKPLALPRSKLISGSSGPERARKDKGMANMHVGSVILAVRISNRICEMSRTSRKQKRSNRSSKVAVSRRNAANARWNKPAASPQQPISSIHTSVEGNLLQYTDIN